MTRSAWSMVACLAFGAGGMFLASNFRLRVESVADPVAVAAPAAPLPEPAKLPAAVAGEPTPRGPIHDPAVQQAQTVTTLTTPNGMPVNPRPVLSVTEPSPLDVGSAITWNAASPSDPPIYLTGRKVILVPPTGANPTVVLVVPTRGQPRFVQPTSTTIDFDAAGFEDISGPVRIDILSEVGQSKDLSSRVNIRVPVRTPAQNPVILASYQNSPFLAPASDLAAVKLYGRDTSSFLILRGQSFPLPSGVAADRFVFITRTKTLPVAGLVVEPAAGRTGEWAYQAKSLPVLEAGATGFVAVRAEFGEDHCYAVKAAKFTSEGPVATLTAPTPVEFGKRTGANLEIKTPLTEKTVHGFSAAAHFSNTPKLYVKLTPPVQAQAVLVGVDSADPTVVEPVSTAGEKTIPIEVKSGRDHTVRVSYGRGADPGEAVTLHVKVQSTGPTVDQVSAPGFGQSGGVGEEKIQLRFSTANPLDPTAAKDGKNFKVFHNQTPSSPPNLVTGFDPFDPVTNTITLRVEKVVPGSYTVGVLNSGKGTSVAPGLTDVYGNSADPSLGVNEDYAFKTTLFTQQVDAPQPSQQAGVPLQPGPVVSFTEYTKFRFVPDGFNPSDRVETRVARLYYYRDAHRVAMIVNRSVKSYAGADVDVRRRAADRARTDADGATDDRKRLENQAVKSAQDARAAETQLRELQQQQATAKVESANARILLPQRELELQQATQALGRGTALTGDLAATDERVRAQNQRLIDAEKDVTIATLRAEQSKARGDGPNQQANAEAERRLAESNRDAVRADLERARTEARLRADAGADPNRANVARLTAEVNQLRQVVATADANAAAAANEIAAAQQRVTALRETEFQRTVAWQEQELRERRARENEFRRDVAAATADPNTYAPGIPDSDDPVMQVSISVIGEGLIQLRGPIKGINVIRIMINQIDAPVGQVRVAMHTMQVNGERGDRMEKVVANIQRYLDHSRFLTTQSSQMLRRSVGVVASRKAEEAALTLAPGCTQADRDQRYLYSFFGKEFTDELALLDSEFLKTGNKLLSLHSMDTTSLASALFVLSLARNDVRLEIMQEFTRMLQTELPEMENSYYLAGLSGNGHKCEACCDRRVYMLSQNARFVSFGGFFNAQGAAADTMTALQREFIRLAQVFKARMITELQLKQRVTERSMVEERFAIPYQQQRKQALDAEVEAKQKLALFQDKLQDATSAAATSLASVLNELDTIDKKVSETDGIVRLLWEQLDEYKKWTMTPEQEKRAAPAVRTWEVQRQVRRPDGSARVLPKLQEREAATKNKYEGVFYLDKDEVTRELRRDLENLKDLVETFFYPEGFYTSVVKPLRERLDLVLAKNELTLEDTTLIVEKTQQVIADIRPAVTASRAKVQVILGYLGGAEPEPSKAANEFNAFRRDITGKLKKGRDLDVLAQSLFADAAPHFNLLVSVSTNYEAALRKSRLARRPLDEKKLLDLLVDELEDKFIEQLEGTRAHTANIDNYIKALSTALDDDFQTQFYNPSFRRVREANARFWDVTLGQVETTTVLVNNRGLALVRPSATFEFDLPKRDIMITEGFKSAKALVDDYGALVNDPSFLALAKLYSGNPVTSQQNTGGSLAAVRSVLPGLPVTSDEMVMAQAGPGRREFGSALEGLIPDPAIYKFETGTGFELRPTLSPDGQNVVFKLDYMYTTDVREPVRADEKHLGRVKRHFVSTDVQLSNYELREVSTYRVALRASRTGKGVPGLQDIPGVGVLFRPLPSSESSLQQNLIYSQATIFPTLFDLMGLRYAPAVADLDPMADRLGEFAARYRQLDIMQRTADIGATRVDDALRTPNGERRTDLYRPVITIPSVHPNGYSGPGLRLRDGTLIEGPPAPPGYDPRFARPQTPFAPGTTPESASRPILLQPTGPVGYTPPGPVAQPLHQPRQVLPTQPPIPPAEVGAPRPPFGGATTGTAPPAGLGTVITPGVRPALPGTPTTVPPPFPAPVGFPAPTALPPTGFPTTLPAPGGTPFPLQR